MRTIYLKKTLFIINVFYFSEMWICGFIPDQMFYPTRLDSDLSLCAGSVHTLVDDEAYCLQTVDTYFPF